MVGVLPRFFEYCGRYLARSTSANGEQIEGKSARRYQFMAFDTKDSTPQDLII